MPDDWPRRRKCRAARGIVGEAAGPSVAATAREKVRVARALGKLPAIDEALRVGTLSYAKARALTRVAAPETEAKLLELAVVATGAQLERLCRGYRRALAPDEVVAAEERSVRRRNLPGGMVKLEIVLAPDEADLVLRTLESLHEWAGDRGLDLGADSNLPLWDGTRPDYDWAVGALLRTG